ncbi:MAG: TrkA family potassium uptake protein [Planctomycetales bacterium]
MPREQFIVIVGCGRLGRHLANHYSREGHSVMAVDVDPARLAKLAPEYSGFRLEGDATEPAVMKQSHAEDADRLIAVTGYDNVNLAVAQVARTIFGVPDVVARVNDPEREAIFQELGIRTVCPLTLAARELVAWQTRSVDSG